MGFKDRRLRHKPIIQDIAATVSALCVEHERSQAYIARQLGVREKTLSAWLTGAITCRHAQMLALALEALNARLK